MDKAMLALQFAPMVMQALKAASGKIYGAKSFLQDDNYDPGLMMDAINSNDFEGYNDVFLQMNTANPSDYLNEYGELGVAEGITPALDPTAFSKFVKDNPKNLEALYEEALRQKRGPANAAMSAYSMLSNNPNIGLEDPSGIGALYDEVSQDYQNGEYDDTLRIFRRKKK